MELHSDDIPSDEIQDLIWAMLDEHISEGDFKRLEELLRADEDVRSLYLQCVQIHVDLQQRFGKRDGASSSGSIGLPLDFTMLNGDSTLADPAI